MRIFFAVVATLVASTGVSPALSQDAQTWKNKAGSTITATFASFDEANNEVTLFIEKTIPLDALDSESAAQARSMARQATEQPLRTATPSEQQASSPIPFRLLSVDTAGSAKAAFDVEVDLVGGRLPNQEELAEVSVRLAGNLEHDRKFVGFYLPGMQVDAGYFATGHHNPKMEVRVNSWALPARYEALLE